MKVKVLVAIAFLTAMAVVGASVIYLTTLLSKPVNFLSLELGDGVVRMRTDLQPAYQSPEWNRIVLPTVCYDPGVMVSATAGYGQIYRCDGDDIDARAFTTPGYTVDPNQ